MNERDEYTQASETDRSASGLVEQGLQSERQAHLVHVGESPREKKRRQMESRVILRSKAFRFVSQGMDDYVIEQLERDAMGGESWSTVWSSVGGLVSDAYLSLAVHDLMRYVKAVDKELGHDHNFWRRNEL